MSDIAPLADDVSVVAMSCFYVRPRLSRTGAVGGVHGGSAAWSLGLRSSRCLQYTNAIRTT